MESKKIFIVRAVLLALIVLWCTLIFCMSAETADISSDRSQGLSEKIIEAFLSLFNIEGEGKLALIEGFEFILRKGAHMFSFFVLSVLSFCFALTFKNFKCCICALGSVFFTLVYALSDEIHQIYVDGRAGSLSDVFIDMIGACIGISVAILIRFIILRKKKNATKIAE